MKTMAKEARRVLLIAYAFPPVGGAGVQRVAKFTKYLPEHGWEVSVLTVSNPSVPVVDHSLLDEIPPQTIIRHAKSWEPDYRLKHSLTSATTEARVRSGWMTRLKQALRAAATLVLQPDPQILWAPHAVRQGTRLLRELPHHAILVSGPPFSPFLFGASLRRRSGLPLVLDYRDEWTISNRYWEKKSRVPLVGRFQNRLQKYALRRADSVIATTQRSAQALEQEARKAGRQIPVRCLYNGFDPADMPELSLDGSPPAGDRFRLAHVGTLWNLTTARPLVEAVERLAVEYPDRASLLDLQIVGRCTPAEETLLQRLQGLPCRLLRQNYVDHRTAVQVMRDASELCLLLAGVPGAERVLPAKTFEYLATGRKILAIAPSGEMQDVLRRFAGVSLYSPQDIAGITEHLARRLAQPNGATDHLRELELFDRRHQAGQLAEILDQVVISRPVTSRSWKKKSRG
jgi:glycosyltransferase involved in cell wall biosynthesis